MTQLDYVVKKLQNKIFNIKEIAKASGVSRDTCLRIRGEVTTNPNTRTVQALYDYFKSLAD